MKPAVQQFRKLLPRADEKELGDHLARLSDQYFEYFTLPEAALHFEAIGTLSIDKPVQLKCRLSLEGMLLVDVVAFDYPFAFSLITGILGAMGMNVLSGRAYTRGKTAAGKKTARRRFKSPAAVSGRDDRSVIIDTFTGTLDTETDLNGWSVTVELNLNRVFLLLGKNDADSVQQAKHLVNQMVVERLAETSYELEKVLYPVHIDVKTPVEGTTLMRVTAMDTPFFLYTLSNALSLQGIIIDRVIIATTEKEIRDDFYLVDSRGRPVDDAEILGRVKFSVLLTKQFSYFLVTAPDPYSALSRFEVLVKEVLERPQKGRWLDMLGSPHLMLSLARLLGASDFIWEDFIRLQYETLLPMLMDRSDHEKALHSIDDFRSRLEDAMAGKDSLEERSREFNRMKDHQIFLIDLDHILNPETDFRMLSRELTELAETVVDAAAATVYSNLAKRYGIPRTVAGLESPFTVMGLGKLGGAALGYASDIELLFVYGDSGSTDGEESILNAEFFDYLVKGVLGFIQAKREGIFSIDLRLRPYGNDGPLAASLDSFCRYYGPDGDAHSYERLSLVRMRTVGGNRALGERLERLRDEYVYAGRNIDTGQIRELREKQFREKNIPGSLNAKFSPGALVDLEYTVQILQVIHGRDNPDLRTPRIHDALEVLDRLGVLDREERENIVAAYDFLRKLINGLRMLRGSARDLFIPPAGSLEFVHLARRMNYEKKDELSPENQLYLEFQTRTAVIRSFVEKHLGRDSLPGPETGNVADIVLSRKLPEGLPEKIITSCGFRRPERVLENIRKLSGDGEQRRLFAGLAVLACDILSQKSDPDMALNNWERYISSLPDPEDHYSVMLSQPKRLDILLSVFSASQFLSETLIKNPALFEWLSDPRNLYKKLEKKEILSEVLTAEHEKTRDEEVLMNHLRRIRRREVLRIGTRDICLTIPLPDIVTDLSTLAEALVESALAGAWRTVRKEMPAPEESDVLKEHFCILAFGKLGGNELNYSSDIDLLGIYEPAGLEQRTGMDQDFYERIFGKVLERTNQYLMAHTTEGYAYRVDLRLRPYGSSGVLVNPLPALTRYYDGSAMLWEIQALLKMRPIAGNLSIGYDFLDITRPVLLTRLDKQRLVESIHSMRSKASTPKVSYLKSSFDVKNGVGGIRDIEFLVQGLQLINAPDYPQLLSGNTLRGLENLAALKILPDTVAEQLKEDYLFLRKVEHMLQLFEDRQVHTLPGDPEQGASLARRILGTGADAEALTKVVAECASRVRGEYNRYLLDDGPGRASERTVIQ